MKNPCVQSACQQVGQNPRSYGVHHNTDQNARGTVLRNLTDAELLKYVDRTTTPELREVCDRFESLLHVVSELTEKLKGTAMLLEQTT